MKKIFIRSLGMALIAVVVSTSQAAPVLIYANYTALVNPPSGVVLSLANGEAVGNTFTPDPATAPNRDMVGFSFEYYASNSVGTSFIGNPSLTLDFYLNNGATINGAASPGSTPFYTETFFLNTLAPYIAGGGARNINFTNGVGNDFPVAGTPIPAGRITWSVMVNGLNAADTFGLVAFDPGAPGNVGTSSDYYWKNNGGGWQPYTNSVTGANSYGAAVWAVPEPATLSLVAAGGVALLAAARRRQRK